MNIEIHYDPARAMYDIYCRYSDYRYSIYPDVLIKAEPNGLIKPFLSFHTDTYLSLRAAILADGVTNDANDARQVRDRLLTLVEKLVIK